MHLEFTWDQSEVKFWSGRGVEKATARALKKSGNDAIRAMRADGKKAVRARKAIRAGYLAGKALLITLPRSSKIELMEWKLHVSGKPVPLGEYPSRQTKKGVSVMVNRGTRKLIKSAFMAAKKTGRPGVFLRPTDERYPMGHRLGPSVAQSFGERTVIDRVMKKGRETFRTRFDYWMPLEVAK